MKFPFQWLISDPPVYQDPRLLNFRKTSDPSLHLLKPLRSISYLRVFSMYVATLVILRLKQDYMILNEQ